MAQVNGREPEPLGTRGLAAKLRKDVDALLLDQLTPGPWSPSEVCDYKDAICAAAGEMLESELLALAVGWGKKFAELEQRLAEAEKRLAKVGWGVK